MTISCKLRDFTVSGETLHGVFISQFREQLVSWAILCQFKITLSCIIENSEPSARGETEPIVPHCSSHTPSPSHIPFCPKALERDIF